MTDAAGRERQNPDRERALREQEIVAAGNALAESLSVCVGKWQPSSVLQESLKVDALKAWEKWVEVGASYTPNPESVTAWRASKAGEPLSAAPETEEYAKVIAERDALRKFIHELRLAMEGRLGPGEPLSADAPRRVSHARELLEHMLDSAADGSVRVSRGAILDVQDGFAALAPSEERLREVRLEAAIEEAERFHGNWNVDEDFRSFDVWAKKRIEVLRAALSELRGR